MVVVYLPFLNAVALGRVYGDTRMDTNWAFRQAYDKARQIKGKQDAYCTAALAGQWTGLGEFPEDLQWEALVDVLRGRVRVLHFSVLLGSRHRESFTI
jgi:hypothetical protein